jgi:hypothetical protein
MGNPVPLKFTYDFSENTIRDFPESSKNTITVPLKMSQDFSIKLIRDFLHFPSSFGIATTFF